MRPDDHGCEPDPDHPELHVCSLDDLAGGGEVTLDLVVVVPDADPDADDAVLVSVADSELDRQPEDNESTQSLAPTSTPELLPATGGDATLWLLTAMALLLVGAGVIIRRTGSALG